MVLVTIVHNTWGTGAYLDINEGVLSAVDLEGVERLVDQIAHVLPLLLAVVDPVPKVHCAKGIDQTLYNFQLNERKKVYLCQESLKQTKNTDKLTVVGAERIEDRENLAVVWNERFAHHVGTNHQVLQYFERRAHNLLVSSV